MTASPIPARAASCQVIAGSAILHITLRHRREAVLFGQVDDGALATRCIIEARCWVCGQPHADKVVIFARPFDMAQEFGPARRIETDSAVAG
ncbi:hypothetical protein [Actinocorallia libanotica]|uniref:hypothetical protein n=1 Tax=Actinocorallia libanotica TaxID=46162 RepID=UPI0031CF8357